MTLELLPFADSTPMPWTNGMGLTREILREANRDIADEFDWRISVAEVVESAPFSRLRGIDRTIVLCDGPRMLLTVDGQSIELGRWQPFHFSGDSQVFCEVPEGPTRDLNVMSSRHRTVIETVVVEVDGHQVLQLPSTAAALVALTEGVIAQPHSSSGAIELAPFDTLRAQGPDQVELSGYGKLFLTQLRRRKKSCPGLSRDGPTDAK